MYVKITGTGSALPKLRVPNTELEQVINTSDEWITSRTGIRARHLAVEETTTELAAEAVKKALADAEIAADDVDMILAATISADRHLPGLACEVQKNIGAENAVAFDINAACSGFLFSLETAAMYLEYNRMRNAATKQDNVGSDGRKKMGMKHVVVIGAEVLSKMIDWSDRSTCVLFGDGAGAAVLSLSEQEGILSFVHGSDGSRGEVLSCMARKVNHPYKKGDTSLSYVTMDGQEVYKFAVKKVPEAIRKAVKDAGLSLDEIDLFLLHQANIRIIESVAKRLGQPIEKFPANLEECGNISAASVPILLDNVKNHGMITTGMKIVLAGFGAGLTWGAAVLDW